MDLIGLPTTGSISLIPPAGESLGGVKGPAVKRVWDDHIDLVYL